MKNYISIDIGGTAIKYGVIDQTGAIVTKNQMKTEAFQGGKSILNKVFDIIEQYKDTYAPVGICISTAGMVDIKKGRIIHASHTIPEYTGMEIKKCVEETFSIACEVENDVNCAGLAEYVSGSAKGSAVALCLTVGTDIGGCAIIDGKVFHGASNSACEVGYMQLLNGNFGILGASSTLIKNVAKQKSYDVENWDGIKIFSQAKKGDAICIKAVEDMVDILGRGIANICYVLNPDVVVLGGGIMAQKQYLKEKIDAALDQYLITAIRKHTKIVFAAHGNDAGMIGAYYHFCQIHAINR